MYDCMTSEPKRDQFTPLSLGTLPLLPWMLFPTEGRRDAWSYHAFCHQVYTSITLHTPCSLPPLALTLPLAAPPPLLYCSPSHLLPFSFAPLPPPPPTYTAPLLIYTPPPPHLHPSPPHLYSPSPLTLLTSTYTPFFILFCLEM